MSNERTEALRKQFNESFPSEYLHELEDIDPVNVERMFAAFCKGATAKKEASPTQFHNIAKEKLGFRHQCLTY